MQEFIYLGNDVIDRVTSAECGTQRVYTESAIFQKIAIFGDHLGFLCKMKNAFMWETVQDRAISAKVLDGGYIRSHLHLFQKNHFKHLEFLRKHKNVFFSKLGEIQQFWLKFLPRGYMQHHLHHDELVKKSLTVRYTYRQDVTTPTRHRVGDVYCTASRRSTTTSTKLLTDKPDHKQTSRKDKQTNQEHVHDPYRQD